MRFPWESIAHPPSHCLCCAGSGLLLASVEEGRNTTQISCPYISQQQVIWAAAPLLMESPRPSSTGWWHHPKDPLQPICGREMTWKKKAWMQCCTWTWRHRVVPFHLWEPVRWPPAEAAVSPWQLCTREWRNKLFATLCLMFWHK